MGVYDRLSQLNNTAGKKPLPSKALKPQTIQIAGKEASKDDDTMVSRHHDTMTPRHRDTTLPQSNKAKKDSKSSPTDVIEVIRLAVKQLGKEAATHRFTVEEKKAISKLIFTYANQNLRTSENEIARIAINFILADHLLRGKKSVLHRSLTALH